MLWHKGIPGSNDGAICHLGPVWGGGFCRPWVQPLQAGPCAPVGEGVGSAELLTCDPGRLYSWGQEEQLPRATACIADFREAGVLSTGTAKRSFSLLRFLFVCGFAFLLLMPLSRDHLASFSLGWKATPQ